MNEMLEVLMTRNYDRRVGVILQRNPGPAHGRACPGGTSVHEGLQTSFTYDFDSRQNDTLMRSTPMQDGLRGRCRVRDVHISGSSGGGTALGVRGSIQFGRFSHFPVFWKRSFALVLLVSLRTAVPLAARAANYFMWMQHGAAFWRSGYGNRRQRPGDSTMNTITTPDGTTIFYKDWGPRGAQPIVFHHGWPLSADDWDNQMLFFLAKGYRVIAHDRRGHGRSTQTATGHDMDTYAADVVALTEALDLKGAFHVGHSTGGGEVAHYVARAKPGRVSKAALVSAVPPVMVKSDKNPGGLPIEVFDGLRTALAANRGQFYIDIPTGPFYGFNRPGAKISQALIDNWWRQGMMGGANAHYECIKAFSETDFNEDLKKIEVPVLVAHGTDDQIVPYPDSAPLSVKRLKYGTLKTYEGLPHGMLSTHPDILNADLLAFLKG